MIKLLCFAFFFSQTVYALSASYSVPIDSSAATNPIQASISSGGNGATVLTYALPEDLVGPSTPPVAMKLSETFSTAAGKSYKFTNVAGRSLCLAQQDTLVCTTDYDQPQTMPQIDGFLKSKFADDPAMLSQKLAVLAAFHNDPVGILVIPGGARLLLTQP